MSLIAPEYLMPAEWEPHSASWIALPKHPVSWPDDVLPRVRNEWGKMVRALAEHELVNVLVDDESAENAAQNHINFEKNIKYHRIPTNDCWLRDTAPIYVRSVRGSVGLKALDFEFNSWGGKYPFELDNAVAGQAAKIAGIESIRPGMVLEGGSIETNGCGTIITTEQCLLTPTRNPSLDKWGIENALKKWLGATDILWLGDGIEGDDTDGHIDDLTRFVAPDTVVTIIEHDSTDPNYKPLKENLARLERFRDSSGRGLKIVELPTPGVVEIDGERLPGSYANFYIGNGSVLSPIFDHKNDSKALAAMERLFPSRKIVPILATEIVQGFGACHCMIMQQPAG